MGVRVRVRAFLAVVVAVVTLTSAGCSDTADFGIRADESGRPAMFYAACGAEPVYSAALYSTDSEASAGTRSEFLWEVVADGGVAVSEIRVGTVPPGFRETVPLTTDLRTGVTYLGVIRADFENAKTFRLDDLRFSEYLTDSGYRSRASLEASACDADVTGFAGFFALFSAVFVFFGVVWVLGIAFWIVKLVEVVRIPDYQYRAGNSDKTTWILVVVLAQLIGALIWHFGPRRRVIDAGKRPPPPPAGWYPDGTGALQWFDGRNWTGIRHS